MNNKARLGTYISNNIGGEKYQSFVPPKLPPEPPLNLEKLYSNLDKATKALGQLDNVTEFVPNIELFIYMYIRKEALLSSQIEGTQSSFSDLLLYENKEQPGVPIDDVEEVSNYVAAINYGLKKLKSGFPLSLRLIKEIHAILLKGGRGSNKEPGNFRGSQNWIGGTRPGNARFVPTPPEKLMECLGEFEKFIHDDKYKLPVLVKTGLLHVQFETIHPFLDGNGRLGRLLITLLLCENGTLKSPALYLSLYFKKHRELYYDHLQSVRTKGAWEEWLNFFLEGVTETAEQATKTTSRMINLFNKDEEKIKKLGRAKDSALKVFEHFKSRPLNSIPSITKRLKMTAPTARASVNHLIKLGILKEISGKQRDKIFSYKAYMDILNEGTN
jgi:Fic family protein